MNTNIVEVIKLKNDKEDLIRALEWLHDNTLKHIQCEDRRLHMEGVKHALDRAWEILEEIKVNHMKDKIIRSYNEWESSMCDIGARRFVFPRLRGGQNVYAKTIDGETVGVWNGTHGYAVDEDCIFEDVD